MTDTTSAPASDILDPHASMTLEQALEAAVDLHRRDQLDDAKALYQRIVQRAPNHATAWSNLGALHRKQRDYQASLACQRRAVSLAPERLNLRNNLSNSLFDAGCLEECLETRQMLMDAEPDQPERYQNLGTILRSMGRSAEAVEVCDRGLALDQSHTELKLQRALALLALGDYPRGFEAFEARWQGDEIYKPDLKEPEWQGEPLEGKTILVMPEQGFGDTVLMARFLPALKSHGGRVLLACKPQLLRLFADLPGCDGLVQIGHRKPQFDYWVSMMSLPQHLGLTRDTVPPPATLSVPIDADQRAESITGPFQDWLKVGVMWSGSLTYRANHRRAFSMDRLYALAELPRVQMFSLYKGDLLDEFRKSGLSSIVVDAGGTDRDFADTAAVMQRLDVIVSVDSAVVHVAGSLGLPVWNLLHFPGYWLYGESGETTPWYPSMRLIRQRHADDWDGVFAQVIAGLREFEPT